MTRRTNQTAEGVSAHRVLSGSKQLLEVMLEGQNIRAKLLLIEANKSTMGSDASRVV